MLFHVLDTVNVPVPSAMNGEKTGAHCEDARKGDWVGAAGEERGKNNDAVYLVGCVGVCSTVGEKVCEG